MQDFRIEKFRGGSGLCRIEDVRLRGSRQWKIKE